MNFNKPLDFKQSIFAIACVLLFILFIISPLWTHGEPDKNLFMLVWLIGFLFVAIGLFCNFSNYKNFNLPDNYSVLKKYYGKPLASIHPFFAQIGNLNLRNTKILSKIDIYNDFIIISFFNSALLVNKKTNLSVEDYGILGTTITIYNNARKLKLNLSVFQWNTLRKNLSWYYC